MNRNRIYIVFILTFCALFSSIKTANAQQAANEEYTGTIISLDGARARTAFFTLRIKGQTSDEQARQYLGILQDAGQDRALSAIRNNDLGSFSIGGNLARNINVVRETTVDGRRRIFIVFERWTGFAEERYGYRSLDYPFGVIELFLDPRTGKGEGTYIAAARIRFNTDSKTNQNQVEIENFGTFPARLTVVKQTGGRR
jgi:hypothetical protein